MALLPQTGTKEAQPFLFSCLPIRVTLLILLNPALAESPNHKLPESGSLGNNGGLDPSVPASDPWILGDLGLGSDPLFEPQFMLYKIRRECLDVWLSNWVPRGWLGSQGGVS